MPQEHWYQQLFTRRMLICVFTGFSSGLPLYLLLNLVPAWLKTEQIDLKAIGLLSLVQFPYTWKFIWSDIHPSTFPPAMHTDKPMFPFVLHSKMKPKP